MQKLKMGIIYNSKQAPNTSAVSGLLWWRAYERKAESGRTTLDFGYHNLFEAQMTEFARGIRYWQQL